MEERASIDREKEPEANCHKEEPLTQDRTGDAGLFTGASRSR